MAQQLLSYSYIVPLMSIIFSWVSCEPFGVSMHWAASWSVARQDSGTSLTTV